MSWQQYNSTDDKPSFGSIQNEHHQTSNISGTFVDNKTCWSLRCSWSIARRRCSKYIFIFELTPGFNALGKDNCKMRRETSKFEDLVYLLLEVWRFIIFLTLNTGDKAVAITDVVFRFIRFMPVTSWTWFRQRRPRTFARLSECAY